MKYIIEEVPQFWEDGYFDNHPHQRHEILTLNVSREEAMIFFNNLKQEHEFIAEDDYREGNVFAFYLVEKDDDNDTREIDYFLFEEQN